MIHIRVDDVGNVACGSTTANVSTNVALESDCDDCRAIFNVGPMSQLGCGLRVLPDFTPEPHPQAEDILDYVRQRREY